MEKLQTSLDNLLETSPNIPLDVKVHLLTGTARGVVYLHSHTPPIAHRDLTARNILIDSGLAAKIADLGVARMVNIQPGQLAATMTAGPGNNLYMPPETVQEEGTTRYNTAIDIFSSGVFSLFTLTQTFPKDLKPPNFHDPRTRRIVDQSEIERREHYIQAMQAALGETHPLVKLTLDCLEYLINYIQFPIRCDARANRTHLGCHLHSPTDQLNTHAYHSSASVISVCLLDHQRLFVHPISKAL